MGTGVSRILATPKLRHPKQQKHLSMLYESVLSELFCAVSFDSYVLTTDWNPNPWQCWKAALIWWVSETEPDHPCWGFLNWGYRNMVGLEWEILLRWVITRGTPISGNHHIYLQSSTVYIQLSNISHVGKSPLLSESLSHAKNKSAVWLLARMNCRVGNFLDSAFCLRKPYRSRHAWSFMVWAVLVSNVSQMIKTIGIAPKQPHFWNPVLCVCGTSE